MSNNWQHLCQRNRCKGGVYKGNSFGTSFLYASVGFFRGQHALSDRGTSAFIFSVVKGAPEAFPGDPYHFQREHIIYGCHAAKIVMSLSLVWLMEFNVDNFSLLFHVKCVC